MGARCSAAATSRLATSSAGQFNNFLKRLTLNEHWSRGGAELRSSTPHFQKHLKLLRAFLWPGVWIQIAWLVSTYQTCKQRLTMFVLKPLLYPPCYNGFHYKGISTSTLKIGWAKTSWGTAETGFASPILIVQVLFPSAGQCCSCRLQNNNILGAEQEGIYYKWASAKMTSKFHFLWSTLFWLEESVSAVYSDWLWGKSEAKICSWSVADVWRRHLELLHIICTPGSP